MITVGFSIFPFKFISFSSWNFEVQWSGTYTDRIVYFIGKLTPYNYVTSHLITGNSKSTLSDINISTSAVFWLIFCGVCFPILTLLCPTLLRIRQPCSQVAGRNKNKESIWTFSLRWQAILNKQKAYYRLIVDIYTKRTVELVSSLPRGECNVCFLLFLYRLQDLWLSAGDPCRRGQNWRMWASIPLPLTC